MSHRAALYLVQVRQKRESEWRLFGDFDQTGTWFGDVVASALSQLNDKSRDGKVVAHFEAALPGLGDGQVGASIRSGRTGITSVIERSGHPSYDRSPDHAESMRSAVLFDLPKGQRAGRLAVHVPFGRSCKGIVERALKAHVGVLGFIVELGPIVPAGALREAVERDAVERVTLIKHDPARSDKFADAAQWGSDAVDRLELSIPSRRNRRLRRDPLKKFLDEPTEANRQQIIEFEGLSFDEASVTVEMPDGVQRTFFLEAREGGHPMTTGISVGEGDRYGAIASDLSDGLRAAVAGRP